MHSDVLDSKVKWSLFHPFRGTMQSNVNPFEKERWSKVWLILRETSIDTWCNFTKLKRLDFGVRSAKSRQPPNFIFLLRYLPSLYEAWQRPVRP